MTIDEMKSRKRELGFSNRELSEKSGVPEVTIQKIFSGETVNPRRATIEKLEYALSAAVRAARYRTALEESHIDFLREAEPAYRLDRYTVADYNALPDEERVELIDGRFYDMAAPHAGHQAVIGFLHKNLMDFAMEHGGPCMPMLSPLDVQLDRDDRTMVQPDVVIICDRNLFQNGIVFGAPDFAAEVLSPSTRRKDMQLKVYKYGNAGVREYWIIDPAKQCVTVYDFEHENAPMVYPFATPVPVLIWNGECKVDFAGIFEKIGFLF